MTMRRITLTKTIILLAIYALLGWTATPNAAEKWDARTTARVNLRKHPGSDGLILSIVPKNHKVRIIEASGRWYKVDVAGNIHGRGWLHGDYVKITTPKTAKKGPATKNTESGAVSEGPRKGTPAGDPRSQGHAAGLQAKPVKTTLSEKISSAPANDPSSGRQELQETKKKDCALSKRGIPVAAEPLQTAPAQLTSEKRKEKNKTGQADIFSKKSVSTTVVKKHEPTRDKSQVTENKARVVSKANITVAEKPAHIAPAPMHSRALTDPKEPKPFTPSATSAKASTAGSDRQLSGPHDIGAPKSDSNSFPGVKFPSDGEPVDRSTVQATEAEIKKGALGISKELPVGKILAGNPVSRQKYFAVGDKERGGGLSPTLIPSIKKPETDVRAAAPIERSAESMGPLRRLLKVLAIGLSGLVLLLLYAENNAAGLNLRFVDHFSNTLKSIRNENPILSRKLFGLNISRLIGSCLFKR